MTVQTLRAASGSWLDNKPIVGPLRKLFRQHPRLTLASLVALLLLIGLAAAMFTGKSGVQHSFYTVKRGDFLISIVEGGTVRSLKESSIRSEVESMTKIISIVPEGTYVHKSELLVELDASQIKDGLDSQEVTLENSNFNYLQAQETLNIQKSLVESNIKDSELKVEFARSDLQKYIEGDWPQQRRVAANKITLATEELERAKDRLNWTKVLESKGYATKSELQADSLSVNQKDVALSQLSEELRLLEKFDFPKRKRLLEATVDQLQKDLERLKARSVAQTTQAEADLAARKKTLDLQQEKLAELKKQLELTKIYAPTDGLVVYSSSGGGYQSILIEEGASVRFRQEIIKLPDITQMVIEIRVHESHITKIQKDQAAYVTIDSMPDLRLKGRVNKVAVLPDSSSRYFNPTLKVYLTEVLIEDQLPPEIKPGVSGRAEIVITNLLNVVAVPLQAVTSVKGEQVCFIGKDQSPKKVPVEVGLYNDKYIEIKSGLREGDELLMAPLLMESDEMDLSGSIVDANEYEADKKANGKKKKREIAGKGGGDIQARVPGPLPPMPLQTLQQSGMEPRRNLRSREGAAPELRRGGQPPEAGPASKRKAVQAP